MRNRSISGVGGRLAVLYLPYGISCRSERGGTKAKSACDLGSNIVFHVQKMRPKAEPPSTSEQTSSSTSTNRP